MAEKNSNEIDALYLSIHADGADKVKTQLNEVKAEAAKTGAAINESMAEAPKAAAATGKSFDDLKSSLGGAAPMAINLVATLQDLAGVAEKFYNIGKEIRKFVEDAERFSREVERMKSASQGVQVLQGQIEGGSRQYDANATAAAGANEAALKMMDDRLAVIRKQLYGDEDTPGIVVKQTNRNLYDRLMDFASPEAQTAAGVAGIYDRDRSDEIASLRKDEERLVRQRSQTGQRIGTASRGLQAATVERDQMQGALSAFSGATVFGDSAVLEKLDKLIELQQQQMNRPR